MDFAEWSKVFGDAKMTTALLARYCKAAFSDRIKILDEFVALTVPAYLGVGRLQRHNREVRRRWAVAPRRAHTGR